MCLTETGRKLRSIRLIRLLTLLSQGWLSGAELRFMLANLGEKLPYDEVDMLLEEAGIDNEGKFRYNEFIAKLNNSS